MVGFELKTEPTFGERLGELRNRFRFTILGANFRINKALQIKSENKPSICEKNNCCSEHFVEVFKHNWMGQLFFCDLRVGP